MYVAYNIIRRALINFKRNLRVGRLPSISSHVIFNTRHTDKNTQSSAFLLCEYPLIIPKQMLDTSGYYTVDADLDATSSAGKNANVSV